jgi:hypothetical protein
MSTNFSVNEKRLRKYKEELKAMFDDIAGIGTGILNRAVNAGVRKAKGDTPADAGYLKDNWFATRAERTGSGVECKLYNSAENAPYVNYGYRVKDGEGETTGFKAGKFILEKAVDAIEKTLLQEFEKSVKEVTRKHDS